VLYFWFVETKTDVKYVEGASRDQAERAAVRRFGMKPEEILSIVEIPKSSTRIKIDGEVEPIAMTVHEAAHELQVSKRTVERLIADGKLAAAKVGGQTRIMREDLVALLQQRPKPDEPSPSETAERILRRRRKRP
jgi:excisionase family DNA binding protein